MAIKDPHVIDLLKKTKTVLEVCPISNYLVGIVPSLKEHPLKRLKDAGVAVTVSTGKFLALLPFSLMSR